MPPVDSLLFEARLNDAPPRWGSRSASQGFSIPTECVEVAICGLRLLSPVRGVDSAFPFMNVVVQGSEFFVGPVLDRSIARDVVGVIGASKVGQNDFLRRVGIAFDRPVVASQAVTSGCFDPGGFGKGGLWSFVLPFQQPAERPQIQGCRASLLKRTNDFAIRDAGDGGKLFDVKSLDDVRDFRLVDDLDVVVGPFANFPADRPQLCEVAPRFLEAIQFHRTTGAVVRDDKQDAWIPSYPLSRFSRGVVIRRDDSGGRLISRIRGFSALLIFGGNRESRDHCDKENGIEWRSVCHQHRASSDFFRRTAHTHES